MDVEHLNLVLDAQTGKLMRGLAEADAATDKTERALDKLAAVSKVSTDALQKVRMTADQAAKTAGISEAMKRSLAGIAATAEKARVDVERVKLGEAQAAETRAAADGISGSLDKVTRKAGEARRSLESVRLAGAGAGGSGSGRSGVGVGPFGSGFGRIGLFGAAVGAGVLTGPAAVPAALGLLAAVPTVAAAGAGGLGALALAFSGVGKAIGGDQKAYDGLGRAQQQFVMSVRSLDGWLDRLKQTAGASMFPGLEKALHSALSPGTVDAVTRAVAGFSRAIGQAGAAWGQYFGSARFQEIMGPLMAAGARGLQTMSGAALHLFDAFGVLGRAAIPLTSWIEKSIADGSRFVDTWLRAKDASGQLGRALGQAEQSLRLVGGLVAALGRAAGALGAALLPVSQTAIKDLTGGLNQLAGIIARNQQQIREIVGGALAAFVALVKSASAVVQVLWPGLRKTADALGGWKHVFELLIALKIASVVNGWTGAFRKLAGAEALGGAEARSAGLLTNLTKLKLLGPIGVTIAVTEVWTNKSVRDFGNSVLEGVLGRLPGGGALASLLGVPQALAASQLASQDAAAKAAGLKTGLTPPASYHPGASAYTPLYGGALKSYIASQAAKYGLDPQAVLGVATAEGGFSGSVGDHGTSFGPFQLHRGGALPKGQGAGFAQSRSGVDYALRQMANVAAGLTGQAAVNAIVTRFERPKSSTHDLSVADAYIGSPFGTPPPFTTNVPKVKLPKVVSGAALLPAKIRDQLSKLANMARNATGEAALDALTQERTTIETALGGLKHKLAGASGPEKAAIRSEQTTLANRLRDVNTAIRGNLQAQEAAVQQAIAKVKTTYSPLVAAAQQQVSAAFSRIQSDIDAALQEKFSEQAAALGARFYQGSQTPAEAQLAAMQDADTRKQLQDALKQATTPAEKQAAQRQIDEYNLAAKAAAERAQADKEYAEQLRQLQAEQTLQQEKLDDQLVGFSSRLQDGKANLSDLNSILQPFGISLSDIPSAQLAYDMGGTDGNGGLIGATRTLAGVMLAYAEKLAKAGGISAAQQQAAAATGAYGTPAAVAAAVAAKLPAAPGQAIRDVHAAALANLIDSQTAAYLTKGLGIQGFASGGSFVTNGPTPILTGEGAERELVSVTPLSKLRRAGGAGMVLPVTVEVKLLDPSQAASVDWDGIGRRAANGVRRELLRVGKRNGSGSVWLA